MARHRTIEQRYAQDLWKEGLIDMALWRREVTKDRMFVEQEIMRLEALQVGVATKIRALESEEPSHDRDTA